MISLSISWRDGASPVLEKLAPRVRAAIEAGVWKAARHAETMLKRVIRQRFTQRTGELSRSFRAQWITHKAAGLMADARLTAGAYSDLVYARIHDEGGVIRPKTVKMLAIPIGKAQKTVGFWPRHWERGKLICIRFRDGNILLMSRGGQNGRGALRPEYLLRRKVTVRPKNYISEAEVAARPGINQILRAAIDRTTKGKGSVL